MIKIKAEIMEQIRRENDRDPRYFVKTIKRINPMVQNLILTLCNEMFSNTEAYAMFVFCMENGLDDFEIKTELPHGYLEEIESVNPEVHDFIVLADFTKQDRMTTLVVLYRVFESELEVRSL